MSSDNPIFISVVVPVYSGEAYLPELLRRLNEIRTGWRAGQAPLDLAEVILVDDAAIDGSPVVVDQLAAEYDYVTTIHLMRNFGQHPATIAGILHSSGDWIVTMDEDLQHSPNAIQSLLASAVRAGADIVYAKPIGAVHETWSRDWASRCFKRMMAFLASNANVAHFNSFRLLRGSLARAASSVCSHETYFDVVLSWFSNRVAYLPIELRDQRFINSRRSGYNLRNLLTHARRLLVSSQVKITRVFGLVGIVVMLLAIVGAIWLVVQRLAPAEILPPGWTSEMMAILLFGGGITFMLSVVLEYLSILVLAAHGKPIFFTVDRSTDQRLVDYLSVQTK